MQLVADEDNPGAFGRHLAQDHKEIVDLLGCQHCRWLVEYKKFRIAIERLDDLDPLAFTNGQLPDFDGWVDC